MHTRIKFGNFGVFFTGSTIVKSSERDCLKRHLTKVKEKNPSLNNELNNVILLHWESPFWRGIFLV